MLSVDEAKKKILAEITQVDTVFVKLINAHKRVLAEPLIASIDSPPFSNSSMDGFALKTEDSKLASELNPVILKIVGDIPAGVIPEVTLNKGEAIRIMTGAMIPIGADGVIPVEKTNIKFGVNSVDLNDTVEIKEKVMLNAYIRKKAEDFKVGEKLLDSEISLKPQDLSMLAMMGNANVKVFRRPRIAIFSSGDELLKVDQENEEGKIRETNSFALSAMIESCGAEVINLGIAKDREEDIEELLKKAKSLEVDLIISSAGVSVGVFDYVRTVIEKNGSLNFWKVNMRPGKPLVFGKFKGIPIIGLPGNPVSAFVSFEVFVRDAIKFLGGEKTVPRKKFLAILKEDVFSDGRETYMRSVVEMEEKEEFAIIANHQGSGNIYSLVKANSLLIIPAGIRKISAGDTIKYWAL